MNKRQAQRLLRVAKSLRESPNPKLFSMDVYVHSAANVVCQLAVDSTYDDEGNEIDAIDANGVVLKEENFCNTPACALGHYGSRGDLQRIMRVGESRTDRNGTDGNFSLLVYGNNRGVDFNDPKILEHFGINGEQAEDLFSMEGCDYAQTPLEAARYIEKFTRRTYGSVSL